MIKKYNMETVLSDFGNDHGLKKIVESDNGEWFKVEDVEWLFNENFQINKLELKEGDILVIKTPGGFTNIDQAERVHDFIRSFLNQQGLKNPIMTFKGDIDLGILSAYKS
jgi:capsule polysaccharide modification protein KpsS